MQLTKDLEAEIRQVMNTYWDSYSKGDLEAWASFLPDDYKNIGTTQEEIWNSKKDIVDYTNRVYEQMVGVIEFRNKQIEFFPYDPYVMTHELGDLYIKMEDGWTFYAPLRLSSLLKKTGDGWKILHQHGSYPDSHTQDGEAFAFEKIKKENIELRDAVRRHTVDLENKNRELAIEASLERVRSVAMGMRKPGDLLNICKALFRELHALEFSELRNAIIHTFVDEKGYLIDYDYSDYTGGSINQIPYKGNKVVEKFIKEIKKTSDAFTEIRITGKELEEFKAFRIANNEAPDPRLDNITSLCYYFYSIGTGTIGISTFDAIKNDKQELLKRFRNVFELAYQRYMDIEKAEGQAQEAKIEASLERMRAVAMSMRRSEELIAVCEEMYKQLTVLGFTNIRNAQIAVKDEEKQTYIVTEYSDFNKTVLQEGPWNSSPIVKELYDEMEKSKDAFYQKEFLGKEFEDWRTWRKNVSTSIDSRIDQANSMCFYLYSIGVGHIGISTFNAITNEQVEILKRFKNVFELCYQRYADVANAEAQAREAMIEAGLERVRSRAMAMQTSEELNALIGTVLTELTKLDLVLTRCVIIIYDPVTMGARWWMANSEAPDQPMNFFVKHHNLPFFTAYLDGWKKRTIKWQYILEGQDKITTDDFLFTETELSQLPDFVIAGMRAPARVYLNSSFNNFGNLTLASIEPLSDEHFNILLRFARVFDLTYTRFNDLKQAEAQAREAQIEVSLERVRSKAMAMQKSEDLADAVAIVFKELDKLNLGMLRCGIGILSKEKRSADVWTTTKSDNNKVVQVSGDESMDIHPLLQGAFDAWLNQEDHSYVLKGEDLNDYYKAVAGTNFKLPDSQSLITGSEGIKQYYYNAVFSSGGLFAFRETEFPDEAKMVLKRFADVFNLTYTRFNDLKQAEQLALQAQADLEKLKVEKKRTEEALSELEATQAQLIQSEKMASLGELTAGIAHEIQNPLNFVNNFSEVSNELLTEMEEELAKGNYRAAIDIANDVRQNLEKINHHGNRADGIVKGMLQHSRTSSGQKELTDINILADEYMRLCYHGLRAKDKSFNAAFKTDFDESIGKINIIPQDIGRVMLNLITNAFYAVTEKKKQQPVGFDPTVTVSTKKIDNKVEIRVADNGNGIPAKVLDKIFQPFFTTKPTGQGTGLGLSLSYDIIKAHGGEIKVKTRENEGTEFVLQLQTN